jgi:hypothetical protein
MNKKDTKEINTLIREIISNNPKKRILNEIIKLLNKPPQNLIKTEKTLFKQLKLKNTCKKSRKSGKLKYCTVPGVYLIYSKDRKIKYIGETDDLVGRIAGDIGEVKINKKTGKAMHHTFITYLIKQYELKSRKKIKSKLKNDFLFSFIKTESKDMAFVIEGVLLRRKSKNYDLINKLKKYQK